MKELHAFIIMILFYRLIELICMFKTGSYKNKPDKDWTVVLISVPFYLVILMPIYEHVNLGTDPGAASVIIGSFLFLSAAAVRAKAHFDIGENFSTTLKSQGVIVKQGLYSYIRHPLYLGNLLFFTACPVFLKAKYSWIIFVMGVVGVVWRIKIEESFLIKNAEEYSEYIKETWALIPWVF